MISDSELRSKFIMYKQKLESAGIAKSIPVK